MKVWIKTFDVEMELKNNGIELDVCDTAGDHVGDLYVTKTQLIWCKGRTTRAKGKSLNWSTFIEMMEKLS